MLLKSHSHDLSALKCAGKISLLYACVIKIRISLDLHKVSTHILNQPCRHHTRVGLNNFEECNQRREIQRRCIQRKSSKVDRRSIKGSNETIKYIQRYNMHASNISKVPIKLFLIELTALTREQSRETKTST